MPDQYDDLFELLSVAQQQAIARGDVKLEALLERLTRPEQTDAELCPMCACRPIANRRTGFCEVCSRRELNRALEDTNAAVRAQRDADRIKQDTKRMREGLGANPRKKTAAEKTARDYGRSSFPTSDESRLLEPCSACGEIFVQHDDSEDTCPTCRERAATRAANRDAYVA